MSERRTDRVPFPDARVRPPRLGAGQRVGAAVLAMVFFLVPFAVLGVTSVLLFLAALVPLAVQRAMAARTPRQVSANRHRLFVNGREVLRRRDVSFLYVTRSAQGATLHLLRGADAPIEVELPSEEEAARLIEVMELRELPVSRFRVDSPASSRLPPWLAWGFAAIVVLFPLPVAPESSTSPWCSMEILPRTSGRWSCSNDGMSRVTRRTETLVSPLWRKTLMRKRSLSSSSWAMSMLPCSSKKSCCLGVISS